MQAFGKFGRVGPNEKSVEGGMKKLMETFRLRMQKNIKHFWAIIDM